MFYYFFHIRHTSHQVYSVNLIPSQTAGDEPKRIRSKQRFFLKGPVTVDLNSQFDL